MYGLVKTMRDGDGREIKLVGNALTFVIYKSYFGRDLLNDIVAFARNSADAETVKKFGELKVKSVEDLNALSAAEREKVLSAVTDYKFDSEFTLNFIAALIATARYPQKADVIEIITEIPPYWLADREVIGELMEFLSLFISQKRLSVDAPENALHIDGDFTSQMLYAAIKTGLTVRLEDMALNVLFDLLHYSSEIDSQTLARAEGKNVRKSAPMSVAEMTAKGRMRG
jgi:hypothetical protein